MTSLLVVLVEQRLLPGGSSGGLLPDRALVRLWAPWVVLASLAGALLREASRLLPDWVRRRWKRVRPVLAASGWVGLLSMVLLDAYRAATRDASMASRRLGVALLVLLTVSVGGALASAAVACWLRWRDRWPRLARRVASPAWPALASFALAIAWERAFLVGLGLETWLLFGLLASAGWWVAGRVRSGRWRRLWWGGAGCWLAYVAWVAPGVEREALVNARERARWASHLPSRRGAPVRLLPVEGGRACRAGERIEAPGGQGSVGASAPDILLVTVDGWRWDHTSLARPLRHDVTPALARHAARAAVFERAYSLASSTRQSFRAMFTGLVPGVVAMPPTGRLKWALSIAKGQPTLASYLAEAGYETIALVSDTRAFPKEYGGLQGFSQVDTTLSDFRNRYHYSASVAVNRIIGRFAEPPAHRRKPRFLWVHLLDPHFPFQVGPEQPGPRSRNPHARHLQSLRYVDRQLDRLLRFFAGRERRDRTWIFLTADHGEQFGEHGRDRHGASIYEEEIHVPWLVWGPGVAPGRRPWPVSHRDLLPTVLAAAGLRVPRGLCGRSLLPWIRGRGAPPPEPVYAANLPDRTVDLFHVAWIEGMNKLIVKPNDRLIELYDLADDPGERTNLAARRGDVLRAMKARLEAFLRERGIEPARFGLDPS